MLFAVPLISHELLRVLRPQQRRVVAAISVTGPADRVRARADQLGPLVADTAAAISRRLGHG